MFDVKHRAEPAELRAAEYQSARSAGSTCVEQLGGAFKSGSVVASTPNPTGELFIGDAGLSGAADFYNGSVRAVGPDGVIRWRADYGGAPDFTMFVPVPSLLADLKAGLAAGPAGS